MNYTLSRKKETGRHRPLSGCGRSLNALYVITAFAVSLLGLSRINAQTRFSPEFVTGVDTFSNFSDAVLTNNHNAVGSAFVSRFTPAPVAQVWTNNGTDVFIQSSNYTDVKLNYFSIGQNAEQSLIISDNGGGQPSLTGSGFVLGSTSAPFGFIYGSAFAGTFGLELTEISGNEIVQLLPPNYNYGGQPAYFGASTGPLNLGDSHIAWSSTFTTNLFLMGTTNQINFGATNTAPAGSITTPAKWISVQVQGESTVYRLPLYK